MKRPIVRLSLSFTKPGEVLFNLLALLHLSALLLSAAFLSGMPELALDGRFWAFFVAGPLAFWVGVTAVLVRLWRSGYRPRFRFRKGLSITGSRACYDEYTTRFGRDVFIWMIPGAAAYWFGAVLLTVILGAWD